MNKKQVLGLDTQNTEFLVKKYLFDFKSNEETNKSQQTVREMELTQNLENEDLKKITTYIWRTSNRKTPDVYVRAQVRVIVNSSWQNPTRP